MGYGFALCSAKASLRACQRRHISLRLHIDKMRPPHLIVLLVCFVGLPVFLTFFSLLRAHRGHDIGTESSSSVRQGGIWAFFSFHTPSTLFPSSAIISLTDDNSTFFLARPADFGSLLPSDGLSGQLWVGSGFGDDGLGRAGATTGAEGELGCSDVPGWAGGSKGRHGDTGGDNSGRRQANANADGQAGDVDKGTGKQRRSDVPGTENFPSEAQDTSFLPQDDGTDDHLHHPLPGSLVSKPLEPGQPAQHEPAQAGHPPGHADIQSLQESAEITGKVVLLSRGGCGFLEKVKWAQRRGGTALIVGDNTQGGPLVTMYARGDTSNITIPSLFTSHTTAHLLASLIPPGGTPKVSTSKRWFGRWSREADHVDSNLYHKPGDDSPRDAKDKKLALHKVEDLFTNEAFGYLKDFEEHDGLWVTLTPTTMSTSPFFDTLLVLVVSPLVTLTVVYALLLLRSRIRRRRWRAPKSVVDRLPVRTYHTMSCSSTSSSSSLIASPKSSSPTSPLLQASPCSTLPRPRSRTTSGIGDALSPSLDKGPVKVSLTRHDRSRKPYSGRQVECVVCLEEYVDGHSRVMSLPCGHEFHAECM